MKKLNEKAKSVGRKILVLLFSAEIYFNQLLYVNAKTNNADAGKTAITNSFKNLQDVISGFVSGAGALFLLWGVFEFGTAMQTQDGSASANAFKRIGGGLVMVLAPTIVTAIMPSV